MRPAGRRLRLVMPLQRRRRQRAMCLTRSRALQALHRCICFGASLLFVWVGSHVCHTFHPK